MTAHPDYSVALHAAWLTAPVATDSDYALVAKVGSVFAGRSRSGLPALIVPISSPAASAIGRRGSGFELVAHASLRHRFGKDEWDAPAAVLVAVDSELVESFAVLAADVARRAEKHGTWQAVLEAVEEWQTLLAPRGQPTAETEVGLWGELWFLNESQNIDRALNGWRGPDRDSADFFVDGLAAEVKTSRARRQHHVSMAQVAPGDVEFETWLVSLWVKLDPGSALTVPVLASKIIERATDRSEAMRRIARAGFNVNDRREFTSGFVLASEAEWYPVAAVPRVRAADAGVSHLRYRLLLDETRRADAATVERLQSHFHGVG